METQIIYPTTASPQYHFWVANGFGYIFSTTDAKPVFKSKSRFKYLGFTTDCGWPKRMNTGRLLQKPSAKSEVHHKRVLGRRSQN